MEQFSIGGSIVFDGALPRQKHPKLSGAKPRADQTRRLPQAACDKRECHSCETCFAGNKNARCPGQRASIKAKKPHLSSHRRIWHLMFPQVAGLHRAVPSTALDKVFSCGDDYSRIPPNVKPFSGAKRRLFAQQAHGRKSRGLLGFITPHSAPVRIQCTD